MPELPEVEVSRRGLEPFLPGETVCGAVVRVPRLRHEIPPDLPRLLAGRTLRDIARRGKYLIFDFGDGWLILHLGMSGSLRLVAPGTPPQKHDHFDLEFAHTVMRLRDPRRFGTLLWTEEPPERHPALAVLGIEPLSPEFDGRWLHAALRKRAAPVKPVLMDGHLLVGVGNIYASESLFRAGISPLRAAGALSKAEVGRLLPQIKAVLHEAIAAGGSTLRDHARPDGELGYFQHSFQVYGREGETCPGCPGAPECGGIQRIVQAGRSTFYCAKRQG